MVDNKHELRLWRTKPLVLAGNTIGNCVENTCKLHTTGMHLLSETDMCSRFSGGKQKNVFYDFFSKVFPYLSVTVYEEVI